MKIYIKSTTAQGYLYIFKHGLGPGTIPKDVAIVKEKDLPNGYTAVWLDRFLTTYELKAYDIPSETEINRYLDRIGYCQKGGDIIPCDDVKACGDIKASIDSDIAKYKKSLEREASKSGVYENFGADEVRKLKEKYSEIQDDITDYRTAERNRRSISSFEDWCMNYVGSSEDTKYFANMVSASQDKMLYPVSCKYYVAGYLNGFGRGLMEDFCSDDFSAVLDKAHEMASEGLYITIKNEETGETKDYDSDMWFEAIDLGDVPSDVYDITSSTDVKAAKWPNFDNIRDAERFLGTVAPDKIALVEKCRNKLLELYAYRDVQDAEYPDIETTIGTGESEIIRDYKSEAAEDWEDCTVEEADELFDDIMRALDDINADEAAAWT